MSFNILVHTKRDVGRHDELFDGLQNVPAPRLESLVVKASPSQRVNDEAGFDLPQLPGTKAFLRLRRLEIDGVPCQISPPGLLINNIRSLNVVDVTNLQADQLLDVLRNSPHLERLELGRSPLACPSQPAPAIRLSRLMALHLIFMPLQVSNFLPITIQAPSCSELFISSRFPELPADVVRESLFRSSTKHFSPILQKLLTRGRYKDVDVIRLIDESIDFRLNFHDGESDSRGIFQLKFELESVAQIEETVHWLVDCLELDTPKIPIRLLLDGVQEVRLMDLIDSHMRITHLGIRIWYSPGPAQPSPLFVHMAQPTPSGWPLPDLEVLAYDPMDRNGPQNEALLDMLWRRYGSGPESDSERALPRRLRRMRIGRILKHGRSLLGEVEKVLPHAEISLVEKYDGPIW